MIIDPGKWARRVSDNIKGWERRTVVGSFVKNGFAKIARVYEEAADDEREIGW